MSANGSVANRVLDLLPVHVRARDADSGGLLRALVEAVSAELGVLETDVDQLYASWFIETCPEWVVPYIADLLGVRDLPPDVAAGAGVSRRAFVANTVAYRRRKGTAAVVEQVARDASGWPARVVEYHRVLAATMHTQHVRLDRPATASLRTLAASAGPLELVPRASAQGALDPFAHTVDVRRVVSGRGRYGIGNLAVFLFTDQVYETGWAPARRPDGAGAGWSVHPLGYPTPLYAAPAVEEMIESLAQEADLPVPLRPRRLLALLTDARASTAAAVDALGVAAVRDGLPIGVRVDGDDLDPSRLRVCGLEDVARAVDVDPDADPAAPLEGWQVMVDAVHGLVHPYRDGAPVDPTVNPSDDPALSVRHCYGGTADVGAGPYDRAAVHEDAVASDPYLGDPARGGPGVTAQVRVLSTGPTDEITAPTLAGALTGAATAWAGPDGPAGGTYVVAVGDDATYTGDLTVHVPTATRLVLVAATWAERVLPPAEVLPPPLGAYGPQGLRPHVRGTVTVTGDGGSSVVLDGLVIEGDVEVGEGALGSLTVSQCTVAGAVRVGVAADGAVGVPSNRGLRARLLRSVCGPVLFGRAAASLEVGDSAVDGYVLTARGAAGAPVALAGEGLGVYAWSSTLRGAVRVRTLEASSAVLDGPVEVENRQVGCVRYSFVRAGSRAPRRYRCVPDPDAPRREARRAQPVYAATDPGSPHYLALGRTCPAEIVTGGEGGAEMGVHHHLKRPVRVAATARLLAPYVPAGLNIGVVAPITTTAGSNG